MEGEPYLDDDDNNDIMKIMMILPTSFELAKRLESTFKRLESDGFLTEYQNVFKEWESDGIIEEVPLINEGHIIPI